MVKPTNTNCNFGHHLASSMRFMISCIRPRSIKKAISTVKKDGIGGVTKKLRRRRDSFHVERCFAYHDYLKKTRPSEEELSAERKNSQKFKNHPVFGIIIPLFNTKTAYLKDLLDGFLAQTYPHFKLFLVDASTKINQDHTTITASVKQLSAGDPRITYRILGQNFGIAGNTNKGLELAMADHEVTHICLCDHDDIVQPNLLYEYAKAINEHPDAKILYCDEDMAINKKDNEAYYIAKPDFSEFLLESCNYINHFFVCDKSLMKKIKTKEGFYERPQFDGSQDYDLYLRLIEQIPTKDKNTKDCRYASSAIYHIPKFLYRWRAADGSTAQDSANKMYAFEAGQHALEEHYKRCGIKFKSVEITESLGTYRTNFTLTEKPLISIIIPAVDNSDNLAAAIKLCRDSAYKNTEIIAIGTRKNGPSSREIHFIKYNQDDGNIAAMCNLAASHAKGEILLFLNKDLVANGENVIKEMLVFLERQNVGVVGGKALYPDGTIEHAGMIIGMSGAADHIFRRISPDFAYGNRSFCVCDYSAVSGSCLMTRATLYKQLGGFDEKLENLWDADFCLKARELGLKIVYSPYADFRYQKEPPLPQVTKSEQQAFTKRWQQILDSGDPYYNANLSLQSFNCELRSIPKTPASA